MTVEPRMRSAALLRPCLIAAGLLAAIACTPPAPERPTPREMIPARAIEGAATEVTIRGEHFQARVFTDFQRGEAGRVDTGYQARLGTTRLRNVRRDPDGTLHAVVPETLSPGRHDLVVTDPWGGEGTLQQAFRVLTSEDADELIAGYRFEPVGPQYAFTPFRIEVAAIDAEGNVVELFNGAVKLTDRTQTVVPGVAGFFSYGRWSGDVELRAPALENVLTVTDAAGRTGASSPFVVATREPVRLRFATPARSVVAGSCSQAVQVELVDAIGAATAAPGEVSLALTKTPEDGLELFEDPGCTQALGAARIAVKQKATTFYFRGRRAGTVRLQASAAALTSDTQDQTVLAGSASRLAVLTAPAQLTAGTCSGAVLVELQDAWGNRQLASAPVSATLSAAPAAGLTFHADPGCSTPSSELAFDVGDSEAVFYFRGTASGEVTLTAAAAAHTPATQTQVILPGPPADLVFTTQPQTRVLGTCSLPLTVEVRDTFGNASPTASPLTVSLAVNPSSGLTLSADPGCASGLTSVTVPAASAAATFYFQGVTPGTYAVTASAAGLTSATQTQTITPPPPDRLVFTTAPQTVVAGRCSGMATLQAQDKTNTPRDVLNDTTIALAVPAGAQLQFFADASCLTEVTSLVMPAQTNTRSFFFRGTVAGTHTVTAAVAGWTSGAQPQTIVADVAMQIGFATAPRTAPAGSCSEPVEVELQDSYGNRSVATSTVTVGLAATPAQGFALFSESACSSAASSLVFPAGTASVSAWFRGTLAGQIALNAFAAGYLDGTQTQTVTAAVPQALVFTTAPRETAAGNCSDPITVQAKDMYGNPAPVATATPVMLGASPSSAFTFSANGSCSTATSQALIAAGADTATFYVRGTTARVHTITASAFNASVSQSATVTPATTAKFSWGALSSPRPQATAFRVTLQARDVYDNVTPDFGGTATLSLNPAGVVACTSGCSTSSSTGLFVSGAWQGEVTLGTAGTGMRLVATSGAISGTSPPFDVEAAPAASAPLAQVQATPGAVPVGDAVTFDASGTRDYQDAAAALEVSWDFTGTAAGPPPWTAWSSSLNAVHVYSSPGVYAARVAVRDSSGAIAYATIPVVVVSTVADLCVVTTTAATDDGATSCTAPGPDGQLSLVEATRIANAGTDVTVTFVAPMSVPGTGLVSLTRPSMLAGGGNVALGSALEIGATAQVLGLTVDSSTESRVLASGSATIVGSTFRNSRLIVEGAATLERVSLEACSGICIEDRSGTGLSLRHVSLSGEGAGTGVQLTTCATGAAPVSVQSSLFRNLQYGIRALCPRTLEVRHGTFHANTHAIAYADGAGHVLVDSLFTQHAAEAVVCGTATFAARERHVLFQNVAESCLAADPQTVAASPQYLYPVAGDFRLEGTSPAVDSAASSGLDVNGPGPDEYFGLAPDRGALESH